MKNFKQMNQINNTVPAIAGVGGLPIAC